MIRKDFWFGFSEEKFFWLIPAQTFSSARDILGLEWGKKAWHGESWIERDVQYRGYFDNLGYLLDRLHLSPLGKWQGDKVFWPGTLCFDCYHCFTFLKPNNTSVVGSCCFCALESL